MKMIKVTELQKQMSLIALAAVFFIIIGVWLVITPGVEKMTRMQKEISQVDQKKAALRRIEDFKTKIDSIHPKLDSVSQKNLVVSHLATLANRQKLEVESVTPDADDAAVKGFYQDFVLRVRASGGFKQLIGFFSAIEKMRPPISVVEMELMNQPASGRGNSRVRSALSMSLVLKTVLVSSKSAEKTETGDN